MSASDMVSTPGESATVRLALIVQPSRSTPVAATVSVPDVRPKVCQPWLREYGMDEVDLGNARPGEMHGFTITFGLHLALNGLVATW
jgi:hypothetical protein